VQAESFKWQAIKHSVCIRAPKQIKFKRKLENASIIACSQWSVEKSNIDVYLSIPPNSNETDASVCGLTINSR
jgi:hypothetical protein